MFPHAKDSRRSKYWDKRLIKVHDESTIIIFNIQSLVVQS